MFTTRLTVKAARSKAPALAPALGLNATALRFTLPSLLAVSNNDVVTR
jgi:hypothetical protein